MFKKILKEWVVHLVFLVIGAFVSFIYFYDRLSEHNTTIEWVKEKFLLCEYIKKDNEACILYFAPVQIEEDFYIPCYGISSNPDGCPTNKRYLIE